MKLLAALTLVGWIALVQGGLTLRVLVRDETGAPVPHTNLVVYRDVDQGPLRMVMRGTTDRAGLLEARELERGAYIVQFDGAVRSPAGELRRIAHLEEQNGGALVDARHTTHGYGIKLDADLTQGFVLDGLPRGAGPVMPLFDLAGPDEAPRPARPQPDPDHTPLAGRGLPDVPGAGVPAPNTGPLPDPPTVVASPPARSAVLPWLALGVVFALGLTAIVVVVGRRRARRDELS